MALPLHALRRALFTWLTGVDPVVGLDAHARGAASNEAATSRAKSPLVAEHLAAALAQLSEDGEKDAWHAAEAKTSVASNAPKPAPAPAPTPATASTTATTSQHQPQPAPPPPPQQQQEEEKPTEKEPTPSPPTNTARHENGSPAMSLPASFTKPARKRRKPEPDDIANLASPSPPFPSEAQQQRLWGASSGTVIAPPVLGELGKAGAGDQLPSAVLEALRAGKLAEAEKALKSLSSASLSLVACGQAAFALAWCLAHRCAPDSDFDKPMNLAEASDDLDWRMKARVKVLRVLSRLGRKDGKLGDKVPDSVAHELMAASSRLDESTNAMDYELSRYMFTATNLNFFHQVKHVHRGSLNIITEFCRKSNIDVEMARQVKSQEAQFDIVDPLFAEKCKLKLSDLLGNAFLGIPRTVMSPLAVPGYDVDGRSIVDAVLYINLAHRTDRRDVVDAHLKGLFDASKVHRIDAVRVPERPRWGSASSHIKALELAEDESAWNAVMICEDDVDFGEIDGATLGRHIGLAVAAAARDAPGGRWDVLMLGGFFAHLEEVSCCPFVKRTHFATSSHCYLIARRCYRKLRDQLAYGIATDVQNDLVWCELQNSGHWYVVDPVLAGQRESWSDMTHQQVSMSGSSDDDIETRLRGHWINKMQTGALHCFNRAGAWDASRK